MRLKLSECYKMALNVVHNLSAYTGEVGQCVYVGLQLIKEVLELQYRNYWHPHVELEWARYQGEYYRDKCDPFFPVDADAYKP